MAKRTNKATKASTPSKRETFHRVDEILSGGWLFTYMLAILIVTGAFKRAVRPGAISGFFNSASVIRHHCANGNFEKVGGRIKLTKKGRAHFLSRYEDTSAQYVEKSEAGQLAKALKSGKVSMLPKEWKGTKLSKIEVLT